MTLLLLIRHGENDVMHRRLAGRMPGVHLNENGRSQAETLAAALSHAPIQAVYSSPLERAVQTAEPLAAARGLTVEIRPALCEVDYGDWQGRTYKQLRRVKLWKTVQQAPSQVRFPNGETLGEVQQRVVAELNDLARRHQPEKDENGEIKEDSVIAVVAHGDIVRLALTYFLNMALDDFHRLVIFPASLSTVRLPAEGHPIVLNVNQIAGFAWPEKNEAPSGKNQKPRKRRQHE